MNFSDEELYAFLADDVDAETGRRIREQMQISGSQVQKWFAELRAKCREPYNVNWWELFLDELNYDVPDIGTGETSSERSRIESQSSDILELDESLSNDLRVFLGLEYGELLEEFSVFTGSVRSHDVLGAYREKLRQIICVEWNWSNQKDDPRWADQQLLAAQLVAVLGSRREEIGLPQEALPIIAAILVQEGLNHFCKMGE